MKVTDKKNTVSFLEYRESFVYSKQLNIELIFDQDVVILA